jgi:hypothetical protein
MKFEFTLTKTRGLVYSTTLNDSVATIQAFNPARLYLISTVAFISIFLVALIEVSL